MQIGFTILPAVNPDFANNTLVIAYGYIGSENKIMIQMRDAKTQELAISFETMGKGMDTSFAHLNSF